MTYSTIPIPEFSFSDIVERKADDIVWNYFKPTYNISYHVNTAKDEIRNKLFDQVGSDDRIVFLSYLINKLTERVVTLPEPRSERERSVRTSDTIPTYTELLHFMYRLIEQEGIKIPTDLFDDESYQTARNILSTLNETLNKLRQNDSVEEAAITNVQNEIEKTNKFLWLGKEDWAKILIGAIVTSCIKEGIMPHLSSIIETIKHVLPMLFVKSLI